LLDGNRFLTWLHYTSSCVYIGPLIPVRPIKPEQECWKLIARPALTGNRKKAHYVCAAPRNPLEKHHKNNRRVYHFTSDDRAGSG
jgi:hypothetical protein